MNATDVIATHRPPRRSDYEPIVKGLMPYCDGEELTIRCSLLLMRDRAIATKPFASVSGWALLDIVEKEASEVALRGMSLENLQQFRYLCLRCVTTASSFDALYGSRTSPDQGEAHAGG